MSKRSRALPVVAPVGLACGECAKSADVADPYGGPPSRFCFDSHYRDDGPRGGVRRDAIACEQGVSLAACAAEVALARTILSSPALPCSPGPGLELSIELRGGRINEPRTRRSWIGSGSLPKIAISEDERRVCEVALRSAMIDRLDARFLLLFGWNPDGEKVTLVDWKMLDFSDGGKMRGGFRRG